MKLGMYAIYDKMTGYMVPTCQQNDEQAIRAFAYDVNSQEMTLIKANPDDFQLEKVGTYDTDTGEVCGISPEVLTTAGHILRKGE